MSFPALGKIQKAWGSQYNASLRSLMTTALTKQFESDLAIALRPIMTAVFTPSCACFRVIRYNLAVSDWS